MAFILASDMMLLVHATEVGTSPGQPELDVLDDQMRILQNRLR